jgi:hypothetical protein
VASVYIVAAFILLQHVDTVAPLPHLPDWARTLFLIALLVGFALLFILASAHRLAPSDGWFLPSKDIADKFSQAQSLHRRCWRRSLNMVMRIRALAAMGGPDCRKALAPWREVSSEREIAV